MLTISADVSSLSNAQREHLAGFILNFPQLSELANDVEESPEKAFNSTDAPQTQNGPQLVTGSNLDKSGLPWDERIHASSKALTADGFWRKKRGVDDALVAQVEGQLKQLMDLPTPAPGPAAVPAPPPPVPEVVDGRQAFVNLVSRISASIPLKKITMDEVLKACTDAGVPSLPLLANRTDLIPQVAMTIEALIASR